MGKDFQLTVHDEQRAEDFKAVFGSATVCVKSPIASFAQLGDESAMVGIYMLDMELINDQTHDKLVAYIVRRFGASEAEAVKFLAEDGMPIRAVDTTITVLNPQKWLMDDAPDADLYERMGNEMSDFDDTEEFDSYDEGY